MQTYCSYMPWLGLIHLVQFSLYETSQLINYIKKKLIDCVLISDIGYALKILSYDKLHNLHSNNIIDPYKIVCKIFIILIRHDENALDCPIVSRLI